ncbi:hypothetical protein [Bradyrhizobium sp. WSM1417]|uniref:hypothetical protein n=1 Tax=Bradyrhizobium sp. WSM1417 TaxID=754500 RepID=UPI0012EC8756|nr:hypothetical protein [Bradyrhizobium sp. WSM1417]
MLPAGAREHVGFSEAKTKQDREMDYKLSTGPCGPRFERSRVRGALQRVSVAARTAEEALRCVRGTMGQKRKVAVPLRLITARRSGRSNCNRFFDDLQLPVFAGQYG